MHLKHLRLVNFRNYKETEVHFSPKVNWIIGNNAQGKTNLIEAIFLLSTGRSFRTRHLTDLIGHGAKFFYLEAEFVKDNVLQSIQVLFEPPIQQVKYNQSHYKNFTQLLGNLPAVLYTPEDVCLITGLPAHRRKFLDMHLSQIDPLYLHHLSRYYRAMKQRNHLLRHKNTHTIAPWEQNMAISASYLIQARMQSIENLRLPLTSYMQKLSQGKDDIEMEYVLSVPDAQQDKIYAHYQSQRQKELYFGSSLYGPHRDDLQIHIGKKLAKTFSSEGQKRSLIAALRLAEWQSVRALSNEVPIFCIDDFSTYLDASRLFHLQKEIENLGQIFLTSPEANADLFPDKQILQIDQGNITKSA